MVAKKALAKRFCVFIDGSLRATDWYKNTEFPMYRKLFPGIRIMIIHVLADPEDECIKRAVARAKTEGRAVPAKQVRTSISDSARSVNELATEADFVIRVVNRTGQEPELQPVVVQGATVNPSPELLERSGGWNLVAECFKPLQSTTDKVVGFVATGGKDCHGFLSKTTLNSAMEKGVLTQRVLDTMDESGDGYISPNEMAVARQRASEWGEALDKEEDEDCEENDEQ